MSGIDHIFHPCMICSYLLYFWKMNHVSHIRIIGDSLTPGGYQQYASFRRIDNFINNSGSIVAITDDLSLLAPNTIIVDKFYPEQHAEIIIHPNSIILNNNVYHIEPSNIYDSGFVWPNINFVQFKNTVLNFIQLHSGTFPKQSLLSLLIPAKDVYPSAFDKAAFTAFEHAFSLLHVRFFDSISAFRGKGRGLTPSGDDFIAGLLYGIHCLELLTQKNYAGIKTRVFELAAGSNLFSNNMLQLAKNARYFKRLQDFLNALANKNPENVISSFRHLTSIGHTSGADLIAGFFALILQKPLIFDQ
jgi:hypothetical protein